MFSKLIEQAIVLGRAGDQTGFERKLREARLALDDAPPALRPTREVLLNSVRKRFGCSSSDPGSELALSKAGVSQLSSEAGLAQQTSGVSLVTVCMNREEELFKVLGSWLATDADEIVIVDWSSTPELWSRLSKVSDARIKLMRIDGEERLIPALALNAGLRFASRDVIFKIECDIELSPDFLKCNLPMPGEFVRGVCKSGLEGHSGGQQPVSGVFGAHKKDLHRANYYDERTLTGEWADSEIYMRLAHDYGLVGRLIEPRTLRRIGVAERDPVNQAAPVNRYLGRFEPAEFEGSKGKYFSSIAGSWSSKFTSQNYDISEIGQRSYRGHRVTQPISRSPQIEYLSEVLAIKQLTTLVSHTAPEIGHFGDIDFELARLLRDTHAADKSRDFVEGIKSGKGLYFIRCEAGPCCTALRKTLQVMNSHSSLFSQSLILTEGLAESEVDGAPVGGGGNVLVASGALVEKLSALARAKELNSVGEMERLLASGVQEAGYLSISARSLADEAIRKASQFSESLRGEFDPMATPVKGACLVTSLYDEQNLIRLIEYVACVVENLKVFDQIAICYEANNGLLGAVLQVISQELAISPGRLLLLPYQKRPTFEELFSVKTFLPSGTVIAVANADIVFDASFSMISQIDLSRNIAVLSRRDISSNGCKARLIHLDNGCPNTFSADAWVVRTPFEPDFYLDYQIGTMQCDSFINHQISTSSRYGVINPCFDIRVFHLHDERFNSSTEKQKRDIEIIKKNINTERLRNNGADPIKGVAWSTLANAAIVPSATMFQKWRPRALVVNFAEYPSPGFGHFLLLHLLHDIIRLSSDIVIAVRLRKEDLDGGLGRLLLRYQARFSSNNLLLDSDVVEFDAVKASSDRIVVRTASFQDAAEWVVNNCLNDTLNKSLNWTEGSRLVRCEIQGDIPEETMLDLIKGVKQQESALVLVNALLEFFSSLPDDSIEKNFIASLNEKFSKIWFAKKFFN